MPSPSDTRALLKVRDLSWIPAGAQAPVWDGVDLQIEPGETVILQGQSGSGKSTLLRCMVYLEKPTTGEVLWRGERVTPENIRSFRHRVVYVHQSPVSIAATIDEELAFPREMSRKFSDPQRPAVSQEEQRRLLSRFGLEGLDWSRRFDELSVGEQQRVALVRCLSVGPQILLLDEPTASLDDENARRVEEVVQEFLDADKGRAALWITHLREQRERLEGRIIDIAEFTH